MYTSYTPPGIVGLSLPLANRVVQVFEGLGKKFIPVICFSPEGKHRDNKDSPWIDDGPTYNIALMPVADVPKQALNTFKGSYYAIDIPEENWRNSKLRLLDFGPDGNTIVLK